MKSSKAIFDVLEASGTTYLPPVCDQAQADQADIIGVVQEKMLTDPEEKLTTFLLENGIDPANP